ncbi:DNA repair protein, partial [Vibrio cholerae]
VKILISIRTDILMGIYQNNLRQDEKDQSLIYAISWNKKEIREILDLRINQLIKDQYQGRQKVTLADVFYFQVDGCKADEFILDRTMLRPRDAIDFVNSCLAECNGGVELNEDIVLEAEEKYYAKRKSALVKEWKSIFPYIKDYLDALSYITVNEFNCSELDQNIKDKVLNYLLDRPNLDPEDEKHNNRMVSMEELLKVWFTVGVIGFKKSKSLTIYSSFEKQELDITDLNKTFKIHPLFYRN